MPAAPSASSAFCWSSSTLDCAAATSRPARRLDLVEPRVEGADRVVHARHLAAQTLDLALVDVEPPERLGGELSCRPGELLLQVREFGRLLLEVGRELPELLLEAGKIGRACRCLRGLDLGRELRLRCADRLSDPRIEIRLGRERGDPALDRT